MLVVYNQFVSFISCILGIIIAYKIYSDIITTKKQNCLLGEASRINDTNWSESHFDHCFELSIWIHILTVAFHFLPLIWLNFFLYKDTPV